MQVASAPAVSMPVTGLRDSPSPPLAPDPSCTPGLKLTAAQASRRLALDTSAAGRFLELLAIAGVARRAPDGAYVLLFGAGNATRRETGTVARHPIE